MCMDGTVSSFREGSRTVVYLGYKRFLVEEHRYQSKKYHNFVNGRPELQSATLKRDGHYVFDMIQTIQVTYEKKKKDGKKKKRDKAPIDGVPFKKQSIFNKYLPY